ncbi:MAG: tRNA (adenosine(37)-N6)-dimethylallyltransferase MiaA [Fimbriimonas sp.]
MLIAVMGTTASGKTDLAEQVSDALGAQLVNNDAFQVYTGLDIGTAKSPRKAEYRLLDIRTPDQPFGLGEWVRLAQTELAGIYSQGKSAVVVGGSGLYVRALFEGYDAMSDAPDQNLRDQLNQLTLEELQTKLREWDPAIAATIDMRNPVRVQRAIERHLTPARQEKPDLPPFRKFKFAIERDPKETEARIATRAAEMVREGWIDEVQGLRDQGFSREDPGMRAHGYRHIWDVLEGTMKIDEALELTTGEVRRYAKRQRTWLRKEPGLIWVKPDEAAADVLKLIEERVI